MDYALKCAFLSFDATRLSANDVDYPIDTVVLYRDSLTIIENRFTQKELEPLSIFWDNRLRSAINELPADILQKAFYENTEIQDNGMHDK